MASKKKILLLQEKKKAQSPNWVMSGEWNKDQTGHKSKRKENRTGGHGVGVELRSRRRCLCRKEWLEGGLGSQGFRSSH